MKTHGTAERVTLGALIVEKDHGVLLDTDQKFSKREEEQVNKQTESFLGLISKCSLSVNNIS